MKRPFNYILAALQWVMVVWGLFTIATSVHLYAIESSYLG
jgi:hypothetical protein